MSVEESLLDEMGIKPFDDIDEDHAPPAKQRTSIQLSSAIRREVDWLTEQGWGNLSEIVALGVHQLYLLALSAPESE